MRKRTKKRTRTKPTAILTADWHLTEQTPVCRTDDYWITQRKKVQFINDLQTKFNCPVWLAGDLTDYWKPSPFLLSIMSQELPDKLMAVYGNHDVPQHNVGLQDKCGVYNLWVNGRLQLFNTCHWDQTPSSEPSWQGAIDENTYRKVLVWHKMTYKGLKLYPGQKDPKASKLLRKYPQFDLIVTGDNHKPFVEHYEGRLLVNPGSLFRMDADQIDHEPRVYLWYAETNTVEPVYLPIDKNVVSREHIETVEQRTERIDAFISQLDSDWKTSLSFEQNIERFREKNNISKPVMKIIYKALDYEKN